VESSAPPDFGMHDIHDPDAVFQYGCAYAAQVMVLDQCWRALNEALNSIQSSHGWLIVLIGARGFPLGEHGRIGGVDPRLYSEQLHVPWMIRFPDGDGRLGRSGALTSHVDLLPTLLGWLDDDSASTLAHVDGRNVRPLLRAARAEWCENLFAASASSRAIRSSAWCLRQDVPFGKAAPEQVSDEVAGELYVRPDDRWEANDVARLCPEVAESLSHAMEEVWQLMRQNEPIPMRTTRRPTSEAM
jgi:arylsulfatase A-like enzyme